MKTQFIKEELQLRNSYVKNGGGGSVFRATYEILSEIYSHPSHQNTQAIVKDKKQERERQRYRFLFPWKSLRPITHTISEEKISSGNSLYFFSQKKFSWHSLYLSGGA